MDTVAALQVAAADNSPPLGTFDILAALVAVDAIGDWEWVQLETTPLVAAEGHRFRDPDTTPYGRWHNVPLTTDATRALFVAREIAETYRLVPLPPGVLALGLVWQPQWGAARALLEESTADHEQLLQLIQDSVLGTTLESLSTLVITEAGATDRRMPGTLRRAFRSEFGDVAAAAALLSDAGTSRPYAIVTTAGVMSELISRDPPAWDQAAAEGGISLDAYRANLRWICSRPSETTSVDESELDAALPGVRLSSQLAAALDAVERIAELLAGSEEPNPLGLLPAVLLSVAGADARVGLTEQARVAFRDALSRRFYGALVSDLDGLVAEPPSARPPETGDAQTATADEDTSRATAFGFNLGTFLGAFAVSLLGGIPWAIALVVAWIVRMAASRARKKGRRVQRVLPAVSVAALIAAVGLAATASADFGEQRNAVRALEAGRARLERGDLVAAMRNFAGAALFENQSVRIRVMNACVVWELGFRDQAVLEAQDALNLGYRPGEASHYLGRSCFLDAAEFRGLGFMRPKASSPPWLIYPRPWANDVVGQKYLQIAHEAKDRRPADTFVALACLADRYDLRSLAGFMLTMGLNLNERLGAKPTPFAPIRRCLGNPPVKGAYTYVHIAQRNAYLFFPNDFRERIPTPRRAEPPSGRCWARFPLGGPCNRLRR
ncbi:MAG: hypothetical protein M3321_06860 [Actinomycetota bacterium]|nr:hypothetical protein [Actinomycetota bacterium]